MAGMQRTSPIPEIGILNNGNFLTFEILLKPPGLSMENVKKFSFLKRRIFSPGINNFFTIFKEIFLIGGKWFLGFFLWQAVIFRFAVKRGHQLVMQPYLDI